MNTNRRSFFKKALTAVAFVPLMGEAFAKACTAAAAPAGKKIAKVTDKAAARLKYVLNATTSKHKKYKSGSLCSNCKWYKVKKELVIMLHVL